MNIALIGYRGTGKTNIGKKLAKRLNMEFIDTDKQITKKAGMKIPKIFETKGEAVFREMEKEAVKDASLRDNVCIACGGGVVLFKENIDNLKKNSKVILLTADPKVIFARIRYDSNRPALTDKNGIEEVKHLLAERKSAYENAADFTVDTSKISVKESVQEIIDVLNDAGLL